MDDCSEYRLMLRTLKRAQQLQQTSLALLQLAETDEERSELLSSIAANVTHLTLLKQELTQLLNGSLTTGFSGTNQGQQQGPAPRCVHETNGGVEQDRTERFGAAPS